jgi:hypothetical protein
MEVNSSNRTASPPHSRARKPGRSSGWSFMASPKTVMIRSRRSAGVTVACEPPWALGPDPPILLHRLGLHVDNGCNKSHFRRSLSLAERIQQLEHDIEAMLRRLLSRSHKILRFADVGFNPDARLKCSRQADRGIFAPAGVPQTQLPCNGPV